MTPNHAYKINIDNRVIHVDYCKNISRVTKQTLQIKISIKIYKMQILKNDLIKKSYLTLSLYEYW